MALPPAIEKAIDKTDVFLAKYPNLTQYGAYKLSRANSPLN